MELTRILRILSYLFCLLVLPSGYAFGYALLDHRPGSPTEFNEVKRQPASYGTSGSDVFFASAENDRPRRNALSGGRAVVVFDRHQIHDMARNNLNIDSGIMISLTADQVLSLTDSGKQDQRIRKANQYCNDYGKSLRPPVSGSSNGVSFSVSMDGYGQQEYFEKIGCLLNEEGDTQVVDRSKNLERDLASGETYYETETNIQ